MKRTSTGAVVIGERERGRGREGWGGERVGRWGATGLAVLSRDKNGRQASSPSVSGEHIVGVSEAVAAR